MCVLGGEVSPEAREDVRSFAAGITAGSAWCVGLVTELGSSGRTASGV